MTNTNTNGKILGNGASSFNIGDLSVQVDSRLLELMADRFSRNLEKYTKLFLDYGKTEYLTSRNRLVSFENVSFVEYSNEALRTQQDQLQHDLSVISEHNNEYNSAIKSLTSQIKELGLVVFLTNYDVSFSKPIHIKALNTIQAIIFLGLPEEDLKYLLKEGYYTIGKLEADRDILSESLDILLAKRHYLLNDMPKALRDLQLQLGSKKG